MQDMTNIRSIWDRAPTDAEIGYTETDKLREFWEDEVSGAFHEIKATTALPFISWRDGTPKKQMYAIGEVVADSIWLDSPAHKALMAVLANSKCPFVAQLKQSLIDEFIDKNVPELIDFELGRCDD